MTKGFPQLKQLYALLGVGDKVTARALVQFQHNYNYVSREVMYQWFNKHLQMGLPEPVIEEDYRPLSTEEMTVWDADHPRPPGGEDYERELLASMTADSDAQIAALAPRRQPVVGQVSRGGGRRDRRDRRTRAAAGRRRHRRRASSQRSRAAGARSTALVRYAGRGRRAAGRSSCEPKQWNRRTVIWLCERGRRDCIGRRRATASPRARKLLAAGTAIVAPDLLYQGEFLDRWQTAGRDPPGEEPARVSRLHARLQPGAVCPAGPRRAVDHFLAAARGTAEVEPRSRCWPRRERRPGRPPPWPRPTAPSIGPAIDTAGFRFAGLKSMWDVNLLPGVVKYGDLPGLLSLAAPTRLLLVGEGSEVPAIIAASYRAAGEGSASAWTGSADDQLAAAVAWIGR